MDAHTPSEVFWASKFAQGYDDSVDYVGPAGEKHEYATPPKNGTLLARLIPRRVYFDFNRAAFRHDYHYGIGGGVRDRRAADRRFLRDMLVEVELKAGKWWQAPLRAAGRARAWVYYQGVRTGGHMCFNYDED